MQARLPSWLPGFRIRVLDGNLLSKTQRRVKELRQTWAAGLPGRVLAVYDQQQDLVTDVFLNPDAYDNERVLLDDVLQSVKAQDLWIADSNFCTLKFLFGIDKAPACFVMRQHGTLVGKPLKTRKFSRPNQHGPGVRARVGTELREQNEDGAADHAGLG